MTDEQLDAYTKALTAERALANGTGDEDTVDYWMNRANEEQQ